MGFTSLLPPPMTSWKVISCPINPAVAGSRAELRRIYDVWNRWFGSLVALQHTDDFLSMVWLGKPRRDSRLRSFILTRTIRPIYVPEITPPAQVGWFVSCLLVCARPTWISTWIVTEFAYLFSRLVRVSFIFRSSSWNISSVYGPCVYIRLGRCTCHAASTYCWKPQCGNDVSSRSLNNEANRPPSGKKSRW